MEEKSSLDFKSAIFASLILPSVSGDRIDSSLFLLEMSMAAMEQASKPPPGLHGCKRF